MRRRGLIPTPLESLSERGFPVLRASSAKGFEAEQARPSLLPEVAGASSSERAAFRRLGSRLLHDAQQLEEDWLRGCSDCPELGTVDPAYADAARRALRPLYGSLRTGRIEDAELHVLELVTDLQSLGLGLAASRLALSALERALVRSLPDEERALAVRTLDALFTRLAAQAYAADDARPAWLESGSRSKRPLAAGGLVGDSPHMQQLSRQIRALASAPGPVLIVGPSGTGKELVAQAIHGFGLRAARPFIAVNCAALPQELIESELFGHERGAFTGSRGDAIGLMRAAGDGTLFLDEVTEMPPSTQAKLLRALEQRSVRPVGGVREWPIHARVLGATNRDPLQAIEAGSLRADLYYRMCVHRIQLAPLAERRGDIPQLLEHFLAQIGSERAPLGFSPASLSVLMAYAWPGNVRELRNVVEHSCAFAPGAWVEPEHLPEHLLESSARSGMMRRVVHPAAFAAAAQPARREEPGALEPLCDVERRHIRRVMQHTRGNKAQAARVLGLSRHQLYVKLERLGILEW
jgi:DNA-binding NtrC family response regulator